MILSPLLAIFGSVDPLSARLLRTVYKFYKKKYLVLPVIVTHFFF